MSNTATDKNPLDKKTKVAVIESIVELDKQLETLGDRLYEAIVPVGAGLDGDALTVIRNAAKARQQAQVAEAA